MTARRRSQELPDSDRYAFELAALGRGAADGGPALAKPMRVFIVDDSATARRMLQLVLGGLPGLEVVGAAACGEEALARVDDTRADVVVMDWQMPGINGVEATTRLLAEHPHVRVVGYTSSGEPHIHQAFLDAGAVAVFAKEQAIELRDWLGAPVAG